MDTKAQLSGQAFAAGSSRRQPADLHVRETAMGVHLDLRDADGDRINTAPLGDLRIDPPLGSSPRKLEFPDGTVFETTDHAAVEGLTGDTRGSILHRYERFSPGLIGVVLACLAAVWVVYRYGLDIVVAAAIAATPPVVIDQIDAGTMETIDFAMAEPSQLSEEDKANARRVYERLIANLPVEVQEERDFQLVFRSMPGLGPNALALPGGTMVLTDELVEDYGDPDIIAGVIGHEIGHVVGDHGLTRLYRSLALFVLIAMLAGDVGPILEDVVLEGNVLLSLSYDREQEREADAFGLRLAYAAQYNPRGLQAFFEALQREYGDAQPPEWMSTHPSHSSRIETIEEVLRGL